MKNYLAITGLIAVTACAPPDGDVYRSYSEIFRDHLWRAKDPVPHPLRPRQES